MYVYLYTHVYIMCTYIYVYICVHVYKIHPLIDLKNLFHLTFYWGVKKRMGTEQWISFTETRTTSNWSLETLLLKPSSTWNTIIFIFTLATLPQVLLSSPFVLFPTHISHLSLSLSLSLTLRFLVISFLPLLLLSPPSLHNPAQLSEVVSWFLLPTSSWSWLIMEFS